MITVAGLLLTTACASSTRDLEVVVAPIVADVEQAGTSDRVEIAHGLADYDLGARPSDEVVADYLQAFDRFSKVCGDSPTALSDMLVDTQDDFEEAQLDIPLRQVLDDLHLRVPEGFFLESCIDVVALYTMLEVGSEPS